MVEGLSVINPEGPSYIWMFPKIGVPQNGWVYNGKPY